MPVVHQRSGGMQIVGVGPITATLILGEVGNIARFPSNDHFANRQQPISAAVEATCTWQNAL